MIGLEDKADALTAQPGSFFIAQSGRVNALKEIFTTGGAVKAAEDVKQSRFPGSRGTRDRQPFAGFQTEVDIHERVDNRFTTEQAPNLFQLKYISVWFRWARHHS